MYYKIPLTPEVQYTDSQNTCSLVLLSCGSPDLTVVFISRLTRKKNK